MKINLTMWNEARKNLEEQIRETKNKMHQPWTEDVAQAQQLLEVLRIEATAMYAFRVNTRRPPNSPRPEHPLGKNNGHFDEKLRAYVPNVVSRTFEEFLKDIEQAYSLSPVVEAAVPGERTP